MVETQRAPAQRVPFQVVLDMYHGTWTTPRLAAVAWQLMGFCLKLCGGVIL